jgi:pre-mRNA cleavage complex 2 protein Pcf11
LKDWIKSREVLDEEDDGENGTSSSLLTADAAKKTPEMKWIIAPNDPALRNVPCPICQEKFDSTWSEEVQDWIWQDAAKVGGKIYHASCYAEVTKDGGATPARDTTPDSVLGKRKAEVWFDGARYAFTTD